MAEFDDGVAPRARAEEVAYVGDGVPEDVAEVGAWEAVAQRAAGPDGLFVEEGLDVRDGLLEGGVEG